MDSTDKGLMPEVKDGIEAFTPLQAPKTNGLPIEFDPPMIDLGLLLPGESGTGSTIIRNTGDKPLTIKGTRASCTCTYARDLTGEVIQPGKAIELEGTVTPKPGPGLKTEGIMVGFAEHSAIATVYIRAEVALPVRAVPPLLESWKFGRQGRVVVESLSGETFNIIRAAGREPVFIDFDPVSDKPQNRYELQWDLSRFTEQTIPGWWVVETDHSGARLVDLRIRDEWTRPKQSKDKPKWVLKELRVIAGAVNAAVPFKVDAVIQYNPHMDGAVPLAAPTVRAITGSIDASVDTWRIRGSDVLCSLRIDPKDRSSGLLIEKLNLSHADYTAELTVIATLE